MTGRSVRTAAGLAAAALLAAPVAAGLVYALLALSGAAGLPASEPGAARVARVLREAAVWRGLLWSLGTAAAGTALAALLAVAVATTFRGDGRVSRLARALALVPLPVPHLVAGVTALLILAQSGLLARLGFALGLVSAPAEWPALVQDRRGVGVVLTLAWKELPFLALLAFSVLAARGAELEEAARTLGAGAWSRFRLVTWPLLWRGLLPGVVAVFVFAAGSYETALLLAPSDPLALPLLTMERYTDPSLEARPDAFVLVLLALGVAALAVAAHEWTRARWERLG